MNIISLSYSTITTVWHNLWHSIHSWNTLYCIYVSATGYIHPTSTPGDTKWRQLHRSIQQNDTLTLHNTISNKIEILCESIECMIMTRSEKKLTKDRNPLPILSSIAINIIIPCTWALELHVGPFWLESIELTKTRNKEKTETSECLLNSTKGGQQLRGHPQSFIGS